MQYPGYQLTVKEISQSEEKAPTSCTVVKESTKRAKEIFRQIKKRAQIYTLSSDESLSDDDLVLNSSGSGVADGSGGDGNAGNNVADSNNKHGMSRTSLKGLTRWSEMISSLIATSMHSRKEEREEDRKCRKEEREEDRTCREEEHEEDHKRREEKRKYILPLLPSIKKTFVVETERELSQPLLPGVATDSLSSVSGSEDEADSILQSYLEHKEEVSQGLPGQLPMDAILLDNEDFLWGMNPFYADSEDAELERGP